MSFDLTSKDHKALDKFLELLLDAYKNDDADRDTVVGILAHVITAAAIDNTGEFRAQIQLPKDDLLAGT